MGVRGVGIRIRITCRGSVSKRAVGQITFDIRAASSVGVVEIPAPGAADEVESARGLVSCEMCFDFVGLDEADDVVWELRRDGADRVPVFGEGCGDRLEEGGGSGVEDERHAIGIFGVDAGVYVAVFECSKPG